MKYEVIVLSGIPGSGKSSLARQIARQDTAVIVSADTYFVGHDGQYRYIAAEIGLAHDKCKREFDHAIKSRRTPIIVDNTNTQVSDIEYYIVQAGAAGYDARVIRVNADPADAFARQTHDVPPETFERLWTRFNQRNVLPDWRVETTDCFSASVYF
jgi:tRNA uridine 5-carbamoylmethylation protein Kti12